MRRPRTGLAARIAATLAVLGVLAGCSQIDTLKPVEGDEIAGITIAVGEVLNDQQVPVKVLPVCTPADHQYTCTGSTMSDDEIKADTSGADAAELTVVVGGKKIFEGTVQNVINKSGRESQQ